MCAQNTATIRLHVFDWTYVCMYEYVYSCSYVHVYIYVYI